MLIQVYAMPDPGIWEVQNFFLTLHLADDIGVIEEPGDLSVQEFVAQNKPPTQPTQLSGKYVDFENVVFDSSIFCHIASYS